MKRKLIVFSLGGSLIVPNKGIDIDFLKKFSAFIRKKIAKNSWQFFIVVGGGATSRHYQEAVKKAGGKLSDEDIDWMGIYSTHLNSQLMRIILTDIADLKIIDDYRKLGKKIKKPVVVAGGGKPGWSTDYDAVLLARDYKVDTIINLTNIKMVYDKDPKKFKKAQAIEKMNWDELIKIVGKAWRPGLNAPFDPMAARLAKKIKVKVIVCDGHNLKNLDNILEGKKFIGTVIE